jgi:hypothetical protein
MNQQAKGQDELVPALVGENLGLANQNLPCSFSIATVCAL